MNNELVTSSFTNEIIYCASYEGFREITLKLKSGLKYSALRMFRKKVTPVLADDMTKTKINFVDTGNMPPPVHNS